MREKLVEINIHGNCFPHIKNKYKLVVKSCAEAFHAVNILTRNKFYSQLLENDKKSIKYEVLINKNPFLYDENNPPDINNPESLKNTELTMGFPGLETIDLVPVIEGAEDVGLIIAGILIIALTWSTGIGGYEGGAFVMAGLGLIAVGIINLLTTPPKLEDFKGPTRRGSYLFDGPENTVGEGGPVSLAYGQLLVGSSTIATTYNTTNKDAGQILTV